MRRSYAYEGNIYFIQEGQRGPIKIGFTSKPPKTRMTGMQCGNSRKLNLVKSFKAPKAYEGIIHRRFREYKIHGEWFAPCKAILDITLDSIAADNTPLDKYMLNTTTYGAGTEIGVTVVRMQAIKAGRDNFTAAELLLVDAFVMPKRESEAA